MEFIEGAFDFQTSQQNLPKSVLEVYNFIKSEVPAGKIDAAEMKKHVMGLAILSFPINFGPF
ncbi:hypothetical protein EFS60_04850 [Leuconostoc lactis]|nr:hypothetical protein [Leuconostoc lactis]